MVSRENPRIMTTLIIGTIIFVIALVLPRLLVSGSVPSLLATQTLEFDLALLAIGVLGRGQFSEYGFRLPKAMSFSQAALVRWILITLAALGIGALATLVIMLSGTSGNPLAQQLSFPQIVLFIWISASIVEEIFTRGFIQGHLSQLNETKVNLLLFQVNLPTFISALFFAAMHITLVISGATFISAAITIIFTFSLGLLAGHQRARSGSLVPAIIVHILGNVGGVVGGIIFAVFTVLITGQPPGM